MVKAILLSGSRATKMVSRFSDWDYLVFTDDFLKFAFIRRLLWQRHFPIEVYVNWGDEKTDEELYRSLCFSKTDLFAGHILFASSEQNLSWKSLPNL